MLTLSISDEEPGYYAVTLEDYSIRAELTATKRLGVHRYTYPTNYPQKNILFYVRYLPCKINILMTAQIDLICQPHAQTWGMSCVVGEC